jgi:hypothetical protein
MQNDAHFAALNAAARVAFGVVGVAVLGACGGATERAGDDAIYAESAVKEAPPPPPCDDAGKEAPKSCEAVIAAGFPGVDPDAYVWEAKTGAPEDLKACCADKLIETSGQMPYRFHCCTVIDPAQDPGLQLGAACTPWGPPVPPPMRGVA